MKNSRPFTKAIISLLALTATLAWAPSALSLDASPPPPPPYPPQTPPPPQLLIQAGDSATAGLLMQNLASGSVVEFRQAIEILAGNEKAEVGSPRNYPNPEIPKTLSCGLSTSEVAQDDITSNRLVPAGTRWMVSTVEISNAMNLERNGQISSFVTASMPPYGMVSIRFIGSAIRLICDFPTYGPQIDANEFQEALGTAANLYVNEATVTLKN